jgi:hypothetical protein
VRKKADRLMAALQSKAALSGSVQLCAVIGLAAAGPCSRLRIAQADTANVTAPIRISGVAVGVRSSNRTARKAQALRSSVAHPPQGKRRTLVATAKIVSAPPVTTPLRLSEASSSPLRAS